MGKGSSKCRTVREKFFPLSLLAERGRQRAKQVVEAKTCAENVKVQGIDSVAEFLSQYSLDEIIGKGSFAQVHGAVKVSSGAQYAVKVIDMKRVKRRHFMAELSAMRTLSAIGSPFVVTAFDFFVGNQVTFIVMERCESSLLAYLERAGNFGEDTLRRLLRTSLRGLLFMHRHNLVHGDFKPDNVLADQNGNAKVCDFGFTREVPAGGAVKGILGTAPFMSPEMLKKEEYDMKTDVWSFGSMAHVLLLGRFPYRSIDGTARGMKVAILKGTPEPMFAPEPHFPKPSEALPDFLRQTLERSPKRRVTATAAALHGYLEVFGGCHLGRSFRPVLQAAKKVDAFNLLPNTWNRDGLSRNLRKAVEEQQARFHQVRETKDKERDPCRYLSESESSTNTSRKTRFHHPHSTIEPLSLEIDTKNLLSSSGFPSASSIQTGLHPQHQQCGLHARGGALRQLPDACQVAVRKPGQQLKHVRASARQLRLASAARRRSLSSPARRATSSSSWARDSGALSGMRVSAMCNSLE